jgi:hypothetical protein
VEKGSQKYGLLLQVKKLPKVNNYTMDENYPHLVTQPNNHVFALMSLLNQLTAMDDRVARFFLVQRTKMGINIPNGHKLHQIGCKKTKCT